MFRIPLVEPIEDFLELPSSTYFSIQNVTVQVADQKITNFRCLTSESEIFFLNEHQKQHSFKIPDVTKIVCHALQSTPVPCLYFQLDTCANEDDDFVGVTETLNLSQDDDDDEIPEETIKNNNNDNTLAPSFDSTQANLPDFLNTQTTAELRIFLDKENGLSSLYEEFCEISKRNPDEDEEEESEDELCCDEDEVQQGTDMVFE